MPTPSSTTSNEAVRGIALQLGQSCAPRSLSARSSLRPVSSGPSSWVGGKLRGPGFTWTNPYITSIVVGHSVGVPLSFDSIIWISIPMLLKAMNYCVRERRTSGGSSELSLAFRLSSQPPKSDQYPPKSPYQYIDALLVSWNSSRVSRKSEPFFGNC